MKDGWTWERILFTVLAALCAAIILGAIWYEYNALGN